MITEVKIMYDSCIMKLELTTCTTTVLHMAQVFPVYIHTYRATHENTAYYNLF